MKLQLSSALDGLLDSALDGSELICVQPLLLVSRVELEEIGYCPIVAHFQILVVVCCLNRPVEEVFETSDPLSILVHVVGPYVGEVVELSLHHCLLYRSV